MQIFQTFDFEIFDFEIFQIIFESCSLVRLVLLCFVPTWHPGAAPTHALLVSLSAHQPSWFQLIVPSRSFEMALRVPHCAPTSLTQLMPAGTQSAGESGWLHWAVLQQRVHLQGDSPLQAPLPAALRSVLCASSLAPRPLPSNLCCASCASRNAFLRLTREGFARLPPLSLSVCVMELVCSESCKALSTLCLFLSGQFPPLLPPLAVLSPSS